MMLNMANLDLILKRIEQNEEKKFKERQKSDRELERKRKNLDKAISGLSLIL